MQILEHGQAQERTLLFFPCTAEPVWAFADTITLLSQSWHVFQVVYDGHQPEYPGDFTSVEQTVDEVISYLKIHGVSRLGGAYGCSMGGACLTRMLALGEMPIDRAIIDGGITPYQLLYPVRKLLLWRDIVSFKMAANSRKILEAAFPPERFTPAGHDPQKEYDAMEVYLKTFSNRTIRNVFWSANNYALPKRSAKIGAKITYWYGDDEKKDRRRDIRFIKRYFPKARIHGIPKIAHAVREKFLPESGAISQIAMSAMDDWGGKISEQNVPVLIVIEGLTMYLNAKDVQQIFKVISSRFSKATVFVETMNPMIVKRFKERSIEGSHAKFTWGIKNGKALAELLPGFRFVEEHSLTEGMAVFAPIYKLLDKLPTVRNISNKIIVLEKEL